MRVLFHREVGLPRGRRSGHSIEVLSACSPGDGRRRTFGVLWETSRTRARKIELGQGREPRMCSIVAIDISRGCGCVALGGKNLFFCFCFLLFCPPPGGLRALAREGE